MLLIKLQWLQWEILKRDMEENFILPRIQKEHTVDALIVMGKSAGNIFIYEETYRYAGDISGFYDKELAKDAVIADNFYGMYLMTEYLFEQGF